MSEHFYGIENGDSGLKWKMRTEESHCRIFFRAIKFSTLPHLWDMVDGVAKMYRSHTICSQSLLQYTLIVHQKTQKTETDKNNEHFPVWLGAFLFLRKLFLSCSKKNPQVFLQFVRVGEAYYELDRWKWPRERISLWYGYDANFLLPELCNVYCPPGLWLLSDAPTSRYWKPISYALKRRSNNFGYTRLIFRSHNLGRFIRKSVNLPRKVQKDQKVS